MRLIYGASMARDDVHNKRCPRCMYVVGYSPTPQICSECGLDIGVNAQVFEARSLWAIVEGSFYVIGALILITTWFGASLAPWSAWVFAKLVVLGVASAGILKKIIGFLFFRYERELMILNEDAVSWTVQGKAPVRISWSSVRVIGCRSFFDWFIVISANRKLVYVPARFRPRWMQLRDFANLFSSYWERSKVREGGGPTS